MKASKVADAMASDLVEPPGDIFPVEVREAAVDDQEHVLNQIITFGLRSAESTSPAADLVEECSIDFLEIQRKRRRRPRPDDERIRASVIEGGGAARRDLV